MNPEEKLLLERTLKLSEENNKLLLKLQRTARRAAIWGFIKLLIIVIPLVVGYLYLGPYLDAMRGNFQDVMSLLNNQ